jgi:hypothetical protein
LTWYFVILKFFIQNTYNSGFCKTIVWQELIFEENWHFWHFFFLLFCTNIVCCIVIQHTIFVQNRRKKKCQKCQFSSKINSCQTIVLQNPLL